MHTQPPVPAFQCPRAPFILTDPTVKESLAGKAKRLLDKSFTVDAELVHARAELADLREQLTIAQDNCTSLAANAKLLAADAGAAYDEYRAALWIGSTPYAPRAGGAP